MKRDKYGGFNSGGKHNVTVKGIETTVHSKWRNMIKRCYETKYHLTHPTYVGCSVCDEWMDFQVYAEWFETHNVDGFDVDKDLKVVGNKIYSPEFCEFVPQQINKLMYESKNVKRKNGLPMGVVPNGNGYMARSKVEGKRKTFGTYKDPDTAFQAYKAAKEKNVKAQALKYKNVICEEIYNHLMDFVAVPYP